MRRIETQPTIACQERNRAARQIITGSATDAALLAVVDALAEIARETGAAQVNEQPSGVVKDGQ